MIVPGFQDLMPLPPDRLTDLSYTSEWTHTCFMS